MKRKTYSAILSIGLILALTACSSSTGGSAASSVLHSMILPGESKWVDSDLYGSVTEDKEVRLQDDFAAAANREWKLAMGDRFSQTFQEATDAVYEKKMKAVTDPSIEGADAEALRAYYSLASDWSYRNSQGVEPLRPYLEDIASIDSQEALYAFLADPVRNPLCAGPVNFHAEVGYHAECYPDGYVIYIMSPDLSLTDRGGNRHYGDLNTAAGLEIYETVYSEAQYILNRLGYSEAETEEIFRNCLVWEKKVANADDSRGTQNPEDFMVDPEKAFEMAGTFPLADIMKGWGMENAGKMFVGPGYAKKLSGLCSKSQLKRIKDYLTVTYCLSSGSFLDRATYDAFADFENPKSTKKIETGKSEEQKEKELIFDFYIAGSAMSGAMNRVYVDTFFDDSTTEELKTLTEGVIDALKNIFQNEDFLSEAGKAACVDKLSGIGIHIAYPSSEVLDYSKLRFHTKEENGSFLDAWMAAKRFMADHQSFLSTKVYDANYWDPLDSQMDTTVTNAFYNPTTNGIYILAGVCEPPIYSPESSYEEKLAGLFCVVGHEITHGFDKNGSMYDKDGIHNDWLPYEDMQAFNDRNDNVDIYYSSMTPYPGAEFYKGDVVNGEATADMGGIKATLYMASQVPGFDYDLYFRSFARMWRTNVPLEYEKMLVSDVHPLAFYRINVGLQQFEEFYETYGIQEGDDMYLAPEKRIAVW